MADIKKVAVSGAETCRALKYAPFPVVSAPSGMALALAENYTPPEPPTYVLPGPSGKTTLTVAVEAFHRLGRATPPDLVVCGALAEVLSGGDADVIQVLDEDAVLDLERTRFMRLVRHPGTLARIEAMLETGKPLRN